MRPLSDLVFVKYGFTELLNPFMMVSAYVCSSEERLAEVSPEVEGSTLVYSQWGLLYLTHVEHGEPLSHFVFLRLQKVQTEEYLSLRWVMARLAALGLW